jgi:DNA-binding HxlR family transcriptional regulator
MDYSGRMPKQSFANIACSIARSLDVVGERWTPLILRDLFVGMSRFEDIRRDLGIAPNVLAARLDGLERHAIVERRQYQSSPVRHEYRLTAQGLELYPVIAALVAWGDRWLSDAPPVLTVHHDCGHATTAKTVCAECGGELTAANTAAVVGPGADPGPGTAVIGQYLATR